MGWCNKQNTKQNKTKQNKTKQNKTYAKNLPLTKKNLSCEEHDTFVPVPIAEFRKIANKIDRLAWSGVLTHNVEGKIYNTAHITD